MLFRTVGIQTVRTRPLLLWMRLRPSPTDRGDVPGWVLITIMTAGLVTALWAIAGPKLGELLTNALDSVTGP